MSHNTLPALCLHQIQTIVKLVKSWPLGMPFGTHTPALHGPHLSHHLLSQPTGPPFCHLLSLAPLPSDTFLQSFALWPSGAPTELGSAAHNRCVKAVMQALGAGEDGSKGRIVLTEEGEQEMTTLWSKAELREIIPWDQVQTMARQARRARLEQRQGDEAGPHVTEAAGSACSLCMSQSCTSKWLSALGAVVCCQ